MTIRSLTTFEIASDGQLRGRIIPRPDVPIWPILSTETLFGERNGPFPAIVDGGEAVYLTAGRIAIAWALRLLGVRPGEEVLIPAYHCPAMVDPLQSVGAVPVFYRLRDDLSADLDDAAAKVGSRTRAFLATHYFGFAQDLDVIRAFCDERGVAMVEDCAHGFFGTWRNRPLGSMGDYAIGSLPKFFPVREGGCIISARHPLENVTRQLHRQDLLSNAVAALHPLEDAIGFGRLSALAPPARALRIVKNAAKSLMPDSDARRSENPAVQRAGTSGQFDGTWIDVRAASPSRLIAKLAARGSIVARRRRNYERLAQAFAGLPGCNVPFPKLPSGAVPYMFPLWIDDLDRAFPSLEDRRVPVQRFGQFPTPSLDITMCPVSTAFSQHVIQLPCHQSLTDDDLSSIIERVSDVIETTRRASS